MREARVMSGMAPEGEEITVTLDDEDVVAYRPQGMRNRQLEGKLTFGTWQDQDDLPSCERLRKRELDKWVYMNNPLFEPLSLSKKSFLGQTTPKTERTDARTER